MSIDFTKPVQTRDGSPVEIVRTNLRKSNGDTILALIADHPYTYQPDGRHVAGVDSDLDLVNVGYVPQKKKVTVEVQIIPVVGSPSIQAVARIVGTDAWRTNKPDALASTTIELEYEKQP